MIAAALAAKGEGPLPPALWRWHICGQPTHTEFDGMAYKELTEMLMLQRVYNTVKAWRTGKPDEASRKYYGELVADGIVGKGVK